MPFSRSIVKVFPRSAMSWSAFLELTTMSST
jgi:hypothetical protein